MQCLKLKFPSTLRKEGRLNQLKTVTEECFRCGRGYSEKEEEWI
jgi:hypothetical protein